MKLKTKFTLLTGSIIIATAAATGISLFMFEKKNSVNENRKYQISEVNYLAGVTRESLIIKDSFFLINHIKLIKNSNSAIAYAMFINNGKMIIAHSDPKSLREICSDPIGLKALNADSILVQSLRMESEPGRPEITDISAPVFLGQEKEGCVRIGFYNEIINKTLRLKLNEIKKRIIFITCIVLFFSLLLTFVFINTITRPLTILARGVTLIGLGKLDTKIMLNTRDELAWLGDKFNEMADNLNKLDEIKRDFVALITHELRTPLSTIQTYIAQILNQLLKGNIDEFKKTGIEDLNIIKNNACRLSSTIDNILDMSKLESSRMEIERKDFDVAALIYEMVQLFKLKAAEKNINMVKNIASGLPKAVADRESIKQVFMNIIGNAIQFAPEGGFIDIAVSHISENPDFIQIEVTDNGIGIPTKDLEKIFDKFYQVKENRSKLKGAKGTGLGLYIVKKIIEMHGGKIWAKSILGEGASFIFTLPIKNIKIINYDKDAF